MLLTISHTSTYRYEQPVNYAVQRVRLSPSTSAVQTVVDWRLDIDGAQGELTYSDAFGNRTDILRARPGTQEIVVKALGQVETRNTAGVFGMGSGPAPLWINQRFTPLTAPGKAIEALAMPLEGAVSRLDLLHRLAGEINTRVAYLPGSTDVATSAEAALISGQGVCQDHAHIFIAAARLLDIPARYVSGYLLMEGVVEQTATHAWAEAWVDDLGWVGFDAANAVAPDEKYVRIACGLDYSQAAPITGLRSGLSAERLAVTLNVEQ